MTEWKTEMLEDFFGAAFASKPDRSRAKSRVMDGGKRWPDLSGKQPYLGLLLVMAFQARPTFAHC